jgi:hypothetical protein
LGFYIQPTIILIDTEQPSTVLNGLDAGAVKQNMQRVKAPIWIVWLEWDLCI